jgi:hypothetical protein
MLEIWFRNFQLLVCCVLLHQLSVTEISDPFCHSVASVTLPLTLRILPTPESQFYKTMPQKAILWCKGDRGLSYSGIDEIPASHLTQTLKTAWSQFYQTKWNNFALVGENGLMLFGGCCLFKIQYKKIASLQLSSS